MTYYSEVKAKQRKKSLDQARFFVKHFPATKTKLEDGFRSEVDQLVAERIPDTSAQRSKHG